MPRVLSGLLLALYPLSVLLLDPVESEKWLIALFGLLLLLQIATSEIFTWLQRGILLCLGTILAAFAWLRGGLEPIKLYPVIVSLAVAGFFIFTLKHPPSAIARIATAFGENVRGPAVVYTRRLTVVWSAFLLLNGAAAAVLAFFAPIEWWALYTGLLSYVLMAFLFALEYPIRKRYQRMHHARADEET